jgi:hypothetical protein
MAKRELVFVIGAFNAKQGESLLEYCKVEVFAKSAEEALERTKGLITKNFYELTNIIEVQNKGK